MSKIQTLIVGAVVGIRKQHPSENPELKLSSTLDELGKSGIQSAKAIKKFTGMISGKWRLHVRFKNFPSHKVSRSTLKHIGIILNGKQRIGTRKNLHPDSKKIKKAFEKDAVIWATGEELDYFKNLMGENHV